MQRYHVVVVVGVGADVAAGDSDIICCVNLLYNWRATKNVIKGRRGI
jgi:hypothetical protein